MADPVKKAVKLIQMGNRQCILTEEHCIPCDMVSRIEFTGLNLDYELAAQGAKIYTATETGGIKIGLEEAKQLRKIMSLMAVT